MNLLPNKTNGDSTLTQVRKRRPSKMHIMRVSLLAMLMTMMILGGATFSNLFTSAAHAASKGNAAKAVRMMPHVGMAKATRMMPRVGSPQPDLAITSVTPSGLPAGPVTETIAMSNLGGPALRDATTPNFVQVNIQVSGLIAVTTTGTLSAPTAGGTGWSCGSGTPSKGITLAGVTGTPVVPVTYSFICSYTGAFPIATGPLNSITVTGTTALFAGLGAAITTLPINVQLVTLYDTNTANNNFSAGSLANTTTFTNLAAFNLATAGLSKTVVSGTSPFAPGQNVTYRLAPSLSSVTTFLAFLSGAGGPGPSAALVLFIDDYLPPGQTFVSFTSNGSIAGFPWTCGPVANTLDTNVTDVQCQLPTTVANLGLFLATGAAIPTVDVTGTFNSAAQVLDYAPNYTNTADFTFLDPPAGVPAFAGAVADANVLTVPAAGAATVSLTKTGSISGNTVTYTLTPSIVGTGTIPTGTVITVADTLPSQLALPPTSVTSSTVGGLTFTTAVSGNLVTGTLTTTSALTSASTLPAITIVAQLASGVAPCSFIENVATVSAVNGTTTFPPTPPVSNVLQVPGTACGATTPSAPALSLSKTGVRHGNVISYTLLSSIVGGTVPAGTTVSLTDTLPTQVTLIPPVLQSASTVQWTINVSGNTITATLTAPTGGLAAGTVLPVISFNAAIVPGTKQGTIIENEATISAPGFAPVSASSTIELGEQQIGHPCREDRNECRHQCPHVAGWNCEPECPHVANWPCAPECPHVASHDCDPKGHSDRSDPKGSHDRSDSKSHDRSDSKSHSGSVNGGKQVIVIKEENNSSKSHSSSSHSSSDSKSHNSSGSKIHSSSSDSKSHSSPDSKGQSHHAIVA